MGITPDPFMSGTVQGYLLDFNQKPPLMEPLCKSGIRIPKAQEAAISVEIDTVLSGRTVNLGLGK